MLGISLAKYNSPLVAFSISHIIEMTVLPNFLPPQNKGVGGFFCLFFFHPLMTISSSSFQLSPKSPKPSSFCLLPGPKVRCTWVIFLLQPHFQLPNLLWLLLHNKLPPNWVSYKNKHFRIAPNFVGQGFGQVSWAFCTWLQQKSLSGIQLGWA